jgi:hypothetical protein
MNCDEVNEKCKARNNRRKKTDTELKKAIDEFTVEINRLKLRMSRSDSIQAQQGNEIEEIKEDVRELQESAPTGNILTGEAMMKSRLHKELGEEFLTRRPKNEHEAKQDVKLCRDTLAAYYDNVNTNWPDADRRHFDAFFWTDPADKIEKIIDFMRGQEALKPIIQKWQWIEVE